MSGVDMYSWERQPSSWSECVLLKAKTCYATRRSPPLLPEMDLDINVPIIARKYRTKFFVSPTFDPDFVANVMYHGFLPTSELVSSEHVDVAKVDVDLSNNTFSHGTRRLLSRQHRSGVYACTPKLHTHRCLLVFDNLKVEKSLKRKCKRFKLTVDQQFDEVLNRCVEQHGENWLHPPIRYAFRQLFHKVCPNGGNRPQHGVTLHSFELWQGDSLVAGEVGYACGAVYSSLSGFSSPEASSAGTIQCCSTARLLEKCGFSFWDLGMELPYKVRMGATTVPRLEFLEMQNAAREISVALPSSTDRIDPRELLFPAPLTLTSADDGLDQTCQTGGNTSKKAGKRRRLKNPVHS
eukprot:TRINITY_DN4586_c0_g1_i4.p1 TRINITY_DN4586_c0_g1~~TRINITY_DN4586_c0_g1_i4.p1  ORF type:complete len:351 (-),score=46.46 TRINITY_DN4586_c0_g1_i4:74-1126(-)